MLIQIIELLLYAIYNTLGVDNVSASKAVVFVNCIWPKAEYKASIIVV